MTSAQKEKDRKQGIEIIGPLSSEPDRGTLAGLESETNSLEIGHPINNIIVIDSSSITSSIANKYNDDDDDDFSDDNDDYDIDDIELDLDDDDINDDCNDDDDSNNEEEDDDQFDVEKIPVVVGVNTSTNNYSNASDTKGGTGSSRNSSSRYSRKSSINSQQEKKKRRRQQKKVIETKARGQVATSFQSPIQQQEHRHQNYNRVRAEMEQRQQQQQQLNYNQQQTSNKNHQSATTTTTTTSSSSFTDWLGTIAYYSSVQALKLAGNVTVQAGSAIVGAPPIHDVMLPILYNATKEYLQENTPQRVQDWFSIIQSSLYHIINTISNTYSGNVFVHRLLVVWIDLLDIISNVHFRQYCIDCMSLYIKIFEWVSTIECINCINQISIVAIRFIDVLQTSKIFWSDCSECFISLGQLLNDESTIIALAEVTANLCYTLEMEQIQLQSQRHTNDKKIGKSSSASTSASIRRQRRRQRNTSILYYNNKTQRRQERSMYQQKLYTNTINLLNNPSTTVEDAILHSLGPKPMQRQQQLVSSAQKATTPTKNGSNSVLSRSPRSIKHTTPSSARSGKRQEGYEGVSTATRSNNSKSKESDDHERSKINKQQSKVIKGHSESVQEHINVEYLAVSIRQRSLEAVVPVTPTQAPASATSDSIPKSNVKLTRLGTDIDDTNKKQSKKIIQTPTDRKVIKSKSNVSAASKSNNTIDHVHSEVGTILDVEEIDTLVLQTRDAIDDNADYEMDERIIDKSSSINNNNKGKQQKKQSVIKEDAVDESNDDNVWEDIHVVPQIDSKNKNTSVPKNNSTTTNDTIPFRKFQNTLSEMIQTKRTEAIRRELDSNTNTTNQSGLLNIKSIQSTNGFVKKKYTNRGINKNANESSSLNKQMNSTTGSSGNPLRSTIAIEGTIQERLDRIRNELRASIVAGNNKNVSSATTGNATIRPKLLKPSKMDKNSISNNIFTSIKSTIQPFDSNGRLRRRTIVVFVLLVLSFCTFWIGFGLYGMYSLFVTVKASSYVTPRSAPMPLPATSATSSLPLPLIFNTLDEKQPSRGKTIHYNIQQENQNGVVYHIVREIVYVNSDDVPVQAEGEN